MRRTKKAAVAVLVAVGGLSVTTGVAAAHPHTVNGHPIANAQLHAPFNAAGDSCGGDPAAYGLETAHHGPDLGTPGKGDGCYNTTVALNAAGRYVPTTDSNPAID